MELLEREEPLGVLSGLLTRAATRGRIVLVAGEAGVGKSALVNEFASRSGVRARVVWGACDPLSTPRALGPLRDVGRQIGGALAGTLTADGTREDAFAALLDALGDPHQPARLVVVVEDAHWADEATLDMLMFLGRRVAATRALIVVTYRDDEVGPDHPLPAALSVLPRDAVSRVTLSPLSMASVTAIAQRAGRDPAAVHELTGGNPLLVSELVEALDDDVPATVRELMLARLRSLPGPARELAELVSIVPGRAEFTLLADHSDALDTCLSAGVLVTNREGAAFRHELLRLAVLDSMPEPRRRALHGLVLERLEKAEHTDVARLAHHAREAGDIAALLRYAREAAEQASRVSAYRESVSHLRSVLPYASRLPVEERADLFLTFGIRAHATGALAEGIIALRQALPLWRELGDVDRIGETLHWTARSLWITGSVPESRTTIADAIAVLEAAPPGRQLARLYALRAGSHYVAFEADDSLYWGRRALELAERIGDVGTAVNAAADIAAIRLLMRDGTHEELEQAHLAADAAGLPEPATRSILNLASATASRTEYNRAAELVERAMTYAAEHDMHGYGRFQLGLRAGIRLERGDWAGAEADAVAALDRPGMADNSRMPAMVALGRLRARRGEPDAAAILDEAAAYAYRTGELQWAAPVASARSELFWLEGDLTRAVEDPLRWLPLAVRRGQRWITAELVRRLRRAGWSGAVPDAIDDPTRLLINGDWAGAAKAWQDLGAQWARAETLVQGDETAAAEALRIADGLGATQVARRWRAELRDRGLRVPRGPRPTTARHPAGLTARQVEVLTLLTEGLTNAQIAERLSMSVKTAAHHVSAVLTRLGAANRGEAAAMAHRTGLLS